MSSKFKCTSTMREAIIAKNDRTIRDKVDTLSFFPTKELEYGFRGYAAAHTTHPFFATQSVGNDILSLTDGCQYRIPNNTKGKRLGLEHLTVGESGAGKGNIYNGKSEILLKVQKRGEEFLENNDLNLNLSPDFDSKIYLFERPDIWSQRDEIVLDWERDSFIKYWQSSIANKFEIYGSNQSAIKESIISHNGSGSVVLYEFGNMISSFKSGGSNAVLAMCELADPVLSGCATRKKNGCNIPKIRGNRCNVIASCTLDTFVDFMCGGASALGTGGRVSMSFCHKPRNDVLRGSACQLLPDWIPSDELQISRRFQLWRDSHFFQPNPGSEYELRRQCPIWDYPSEVSSDCSESMSVYATQYMNTNCCDYESVTYPKHWYDRNTEKLQLQFYQPYCYYVYYTYLENYRMNQDYKAIINRSYQRHCNYSVIFGLYQNMLQIKDPRRSIKWKKPFRKEAGDNAFEYGKICDRNMFQILSTVHDIQTNNEQQNNAVLDQSWKWRKCESLEDKTNSKIIENFCTFKTKEMTSSQIRAKTYSVKIHKNAKSVNAAIPAVAIKLIDKGYLHLIKEENAIIDKSNNVNNNKKSRGGNRNWKGVFLKNKLTVIWAHKSDDEIIKDAHFLSTHRISIPSFSFCFGAEEIQSAQKVFDEASKNVGNEKVEGVSEDLVIDKIVKQEWNCRTCYIDNSFWKETCDLCGCSKPETVTIIVDSSETTNNRQTICDYNKNNNTNMHTDDESDENNNINNNINMHIDENDDQYDENINNNNNDNNYNNNDHLNISDILVNNNIANKNNNKYNNTNMDIDEMDENNNNMNNNASLGAFDCINTNITSDKSEISVNNNITDKNNNNNNINEYTSNPLANLKQNLLKFKNKQLRQELNNTIAVQLSNNKNSSHTILPFVIQKDAASKTTDNNTLCENMDEKDSLFDKILNGMANPRDALSVSTTIPLPSSDDEQDVIDSSSVLFVALMNNSTPIANFIATLSDSLQNLFKINCNWDTISDLSKSDTKTLKLFLASNKISLKGPTAVIEGVENEYEEIMRKLHVFNASTN